MVFYTYLLQMFAVANSGILDTLLSWADFKQSKDLKKTDGTKTQRLRGIVKLEDANDAGGRNSDKCTLILTEGDSAKALAVSFCHVKKCFWCSYFTLNFN